MIKVSNEVKVYEVDGSEHVGLNEPTITVRSHWNRSSLVVIEAGGRELTVLAVDLKAAIDNAGNTGPR